MNCGSVQDDHVLEQQVKVCLVWRGGWRLDTTTVDGSSLDSALAHGPVCEAEDGCVRCRSAEGTQARQDADRIPLPTGRDLLDMLAAAFGVAFVSETELFEFRYLREVNLTGSPARRQMLNTLAAEFGFQLITDTNFATLRAEKNRMHHALATAAADAVEVKNALAQLERSLNGSPQL